MDKKSIFIIFLLVLNILGVIYITKVENEIAEREEQFHEILVSEREQYVQLFASNFISLFNRVKDQNYSDDDFCMEVNGVLVEDDFCAVLTQSIRNHYENNSNDFRVETWKLYTESTETENDYDYWILSIYIDLQTSDVHWQDLRMYYENDNWYLIYTDIVYTVRNEG